MKQKVLFELIWLCITAIIAVIIILPIYFNVKEYPFYVDNIVLIIISVTFIRYIFLLKHHWITYSKWFKLILIFTPIAIILYLVDVLHNFNLFTDQEGIKSIMSDSPYKLQNQMAFYIKTEMLFFWVASFISTIFLPFRMIKSLWTKINKGKH
ncbi:MAG: hypothetical protein HKN40_06940 [Winogradskyella sp.]|uniref:hypothetical protein n=1 Tax=Winogradskyella sp. TaxID=1883156 RepID=UPI00184F569C|nr:hypothetical protein [Winogradskyella sp.]